ncbi:MAG: hypothetical protein ACR2IF_02535 [Terriglobales bacterium]
MDVRAIILIGGAKPEFGPEAESFAGTPLALHDVLGRPVLHRIVDRLQAQGIGAISVISEMPMPPLEGAIRNAQQALNWTTVAAGQLFRVAENAFSDHAQAGAEGVLVLRLGGYAEFEVEEFLQRHLDGRAHVTRAVDGNGAGLGLFMIASSRRNDAAYLFRHHLQQCRAASGEWVFRGYFNPLASARDLRALAVDALMQRVPLASIGEERRPGIWIAPSARVDRRARILAPAFIGAHANVRAAAVITRGSVIEHHAEIDTGTVIENATVLPYTCIGPGLDVAHAVAGGRRLLHLARNVEVEISDPRLMDTVSEHASLRALSSAASLAAYLPLQFFRGLFATSHRDQPKEFPAAAHAPSSALSAPAGFEASREASSFPASLAVARRYGDQ